MLNIVGRWRCSILEKPKQLPSWSLRRDFLGNRTYAGLSLISLSVHRIRSWNFSMLVRKVSSFIWCIYLHEFEKNRRWSNTNGIRTFKSEGLYPPSKGRTKPRNEGQWILSKIYYREGYWVQWLFIMKKNSNVPRCHDNGPLKLATGKTHFYQFRCTERGSFSAGSNKIAVSTG